MDDPLVRSAEWLRLAMRGSTMGVWYWNEDTAGVTWDAQAAEIFGLDPAGEKSLDVFYGCLHPADRELVKKNWRFQLEHQLPYDLEFRALLPDGTIRYVHALGRGHYDKTGQARRMVGVVFDVTERRRAERERLDLSGRLITAQEEERRHVARELHDDFSQRMAVLAIQLTQVANRTQELAPEAHARIMASIDSIKTISYDLRQLSHRLHSTKLDLLGLTASTKSLCEEFSHRHGIAVRFVPSDLPPVIPAETALCLYRVLQEALNNVRKHSGASEVEVALRGEAAAMSLAVTDNGVGFDAGARMPSGIGIQSMEERARMVSGTLVVRSRPKRGTTVVVTVPG